MDEKKRIELEKLKKVGLDILKEFIRVCDLLDLKYYSAYGTLIGAVRHEGYIPWDDDVDVYMPRPDYEIFMKEAKKYLKDNYFVQNNDTDPEYLLRFAKLRDSNTTFIEEEYKKYTINHGIFIDIFPLDGYVKGKDFLLDMRIKQKAFEESDNEVKFKNSLSTFNMKVIQKIGPILNKKINLEKTMNSYEDIAKKFSYKDSDYVAEMVGSIYIVPMKKEVFGEGKLMKFEDIYARVPDDYDTCLKLLYGDYMKLPPKEQREPHHNFVAMDTEKSYWEYIGKFKK
ncbi:MAG: LicD family protein [Tissierellia bacterium]|nr:LicD family protein [Tissierellia bacterium]